MDDEDDTYVHNIIDYLMGVCHVYSNTCKLCENVCMSNKHICVLDNKNNIVYIWYWQNDIWCALINNVHIWNSVLLLE